MASLKSTEYRDSIGRRIIKYNISTVSDKAEIVAKPWDREVFDGGYSGYTILKLQGYCAKVGKTKRDLKVTIPSGSTGYVVSWGASTVGGSSVDGAETLVSLRATCDLKGVYHKNTFVDLDQFLLKNASQEHTFIHPIKLPGRTDIKLSAQNVRSTSAARVYGHAEIYYKT